MRLPVVSPLKVPELSCASEDGFGKVGVSFGGSFEGSFEGSFGGSFGGSTMTEGVSAAFGAGGPRVLALALDEDEELCPKPESDLDFLNGFQGNFAIELYNNYA